MQRWTEVEKHIKNFSHKTCFIGSKNVNMVMSFGNLVTLFIQSNISLAAKAKGVSPRKCNLKFFAQSKFVIWFFKQQCQNVNCVNRS